MPTDVIMPQMGESIFEGTLTKWLKKPGDKVQRDEPLFEISTDKVDAEIPAPASGTLAEIKVPEGTTVQVNTVVGTIAAEGESVAAGKAPAAKAAPAAEKPKAAAEAPAKPAKPAEVPAKPAEPDARPLERKAVAEQKDTVIEFPSTDRDQEGRRIRSSPLVRRIARDNNVNLGGVPGTGLGGRISKNDIVAYLQTPGAAQAARPLASSGGAAQAAAPIPSRGATAPAIPMPAAQPVGAGVPGEIVPMTTMRKKIAEHMVASKHTSAHVHTVFEVDMTRIAKLREKEKASFEQRNGAKLTYMPFIALAAVNAIRQFPIINSSLEGDNIHYKREINLGIAVALEWGLIVPVIKHAEERNFLGLARAIQDAGERARGKKLAPDDISGGTFTITNPGSFGALFGTPIINQPQVAILGVGGVHKAPVVVTGEDGSDSIAIRTIVHLVLGFDHRVIDGAVADQFMAVLKRNLEDWNEPIG
jgi:pyruvate dehydrogenase E2 component (dihydrolipoamide acetyltransferase)